MALTSIEIERELRHSWFDSLEPEQWVARGIAPSVIRLDVDGFRGFSGGRGIWYDGSRTSALAAPGVTVSVLHTGRHYPDDITDDSIIYHYPVTGSPGRDTKEVQATKNARDLNVPVFVISEAGPARDVYFSWVADWDDAQNEFLILFAESRTPPALQQPDQSEWVKFSNRPIRRAEVARRERDPAFAFRVRQRYGGECAVCGLARTGLVEGAHIIPVEERGSDDPRNGLPLCPTHHRAFDMNAFLINPHTLELVTPGVDSLNDLRIARPSINHLRAKPHRDALQWRWDRVMTE